MSKRRLCTFTDDLKNEFTFIKRTKLDSNVQCDICNSIFTIGSGGKSDIKRHISTEKHKRALLAVASSKKITSSFRSREFGSKEKELAIAEAVFSFHTIHHNQTFRSMDCTSKLIRAFFEPKFTCARTKTEAIIKNVLAPYTIDELLKTLKNVKFISIFTDASNHKETKLFPSIIRFFDHKKGVQIKLLDFVSLPGEKSDMIANSIIDILKKNGIENKVAAVCADNANVNFGGLLRNGTNNVYYKLKNELKIPIIGVGCAAHIIHNTIQSAADQLPLDVEGIVIKIYSHFYIFTIRVELLKEFCDNAEVEYTRLLGYSKTRWLALMPAIERVLKLYSPLKSYFLSMENCPKILKTFFEDDKSKAWLYFMHNQAATFHSAVTSVEGDKNTIMEVASDIENLLTKLKERMNMQYLPITVRNELNSLEENGFPIINAFKLNVTKFYKKCIEYLKLRTSQFEQVECLQWVNLRNEINWHNVEKSFEYISKFGNKTHLLDDEKEESALFDEVSYIKKYAAEKINEWNREKTPTDTRWLEIFKHFENNEIPFQNIKKLVEFALCLPGTNAATERVFSTMNKLWTSEKSQLSVETLKAILQVKTNLGNSCEEFHKSISANDELLKKIHLAEKYVN